MNKELIITLLRKDIHELEIITKGFEEMTIYPQSILQLAHQKAENIVNCLHSLSNIKEKNAKPAIENQIKAKEINPVDHFITHSKKESEVKENQKEVEVKIENFEILLPTVEEKVKKPITAMPVEEIDLNQAEEIKAIEKPILNTEADFEEKSKQKKKIENEANPINEIHKHKGNSNEAAGKAGISSGAVITLGDSLAKPDNSVSAIMANKKVDEIKQAMSIADRFRFQRELFNGNGELMNKTIIILNQLNSFDEAITHLHMKFEWDEQSEIVSDFYQILKRKFAD